MKFTKKEIARRQIDTALELFFEKKDILSIITLAGASEEISGKLLKRLGEFNSMDIIIDTGKGIVKDKWNEKKFVSSRRINGIRNNLKHVINNEGDDLEINFDDVLLMLARAVSNYFTTVHFFSTKCRYGIEQELAMPHLRNTQEVSILAEKDLNHIAFYDE